tara:strand:+ start:115 stop:342 length:228 start_codon:yes stop_codon:yes gene_type:complete
MKLSNQAMGAVMMALQKCIIEQSDIVEILKGFQFELGVEKDAADDAESELYVKNPPAVSAPDILAEEVDESQVIN